MVSERREIGPGTGGENKRTVLLLCHGLTIIFLLAITFLAFWSWNRLPAKVPVHFGAGGLPDRWAEKGGEFALLFVVPWLLTGMMYGFSLLTPWFRRHPQWLNIPNKKKFLALPPERQAPFFAMLDLFYAGMAASLNLLFLLMNIASVQIALGAWDRLPWWSIWLPLAVIFSVAIANTVWMLVVVRRILREPS